MPIVVQNAGGGGEAIVYRVHTEVLETEGTTVQEETTTMTKHKEFRIDELAQTTQPCTLRIEFNLASPTASQWAQGQIYRNGSPVGTLRQTQGAGYTVYTEDIAGWSEGDFIQVYLKHTNPGISRNDSFKVLGIIDSVTVNAAAFVKTLP